MKSVFLAGIACLVLASGCASAVPTSTAATTSAPFVTRQANVSRRLLREGAASSLRTTAAYKTRCESGDDSACLVAGSFER
jgi:hypothetical protein